MLGAYNNTVKNPDPEKIVKPISATLPQHCRPCCYCTNTETFLIQWSTNICQKHASSENKLEWTQLLQKQGERNASPNRRSGAATERVSVLKVGSAPAPPTHTHTPPGPQAPEPRCQLRHIPRETPSNNDYKSTCTQPDFAAPFTAPPPPLIASSVTVQVSCVCVCGGGGSQEARPRKTSLHGGKQQLKRGWQRNLPSSPGGGQSRYVIPPLDCKLSKHKAQDTELPAPTKEAKGKAGVLSAECSRFSKKRTLVFLTKLFCTEIPQNEKNPL